jgi:hypothetical protein
MLKKILSLVEEEMKKIKIRNQNLPMFAKERRKVDGDFALTMSQHPEYFPREIVRTLEAKQHNMENFIVMEEMKKNGLLSEEKRTKWANSVKIMGQNLAKLLLTEESDKLIFLLRSLEKNVFSMHFLAPPIEAKTILLLFYESIQTEACLENFPQKLKEVVREADFGQSRALLKKIIEVINQCKNIKKAKKETLEEPPKKKESPLEDTKKIEREEANEQEETLQTTEDLRTALEVARQNFQEIQEDIKTIRETSELEATLDFFREMNSMKYGHLLDQIACVEKQIRDLKGKGVSFSSEFENIAIVIRMFMKFVREYGLSSIESIGERKKITLQESENMNILERILKMKAKQKK